MGENVIPHSNLESKTRQNLWLWIILLAVVLLTTAIRIRLLDIPLERDEGEHAYAAQVILDGFPPYARVYNMIMPGVDIAYALFMAVFGQSLRAIHIGLLLCNKATVLLLFLLAKQRFNLFVAVVTASAFALLSLGQWVHGFSANTEQFAVLFVIAGLLLLSQTSNQQKLPALFAAAFLLGISFLMKQHAAAFILFAGLYLFFSRLACRPFNKKNLCTSCAVFLIAVSLPFLITCFVLWRYGVFEKFCFFTFTYNLKYVSSIPLSTGLTHLKINLSLIAGSALLIWLLAAMGLSALWWNKQFRHRRLFVLAFLLFSFLAVCPGLYFRKHYFVLLLPAVALLAGIGADSLLHIFTRSKSVLWATLGPVLLTIVVLLHTLYQQRAYFFVMSPIEISRKTYGMNPFAESLNVAQFIKNNSGKDDRIAVLGSEPQIYFYSDRRSVTGYIYTYPLMEDHPYAKTMQQEMIREIEAARPKFLVFVNVPTSWAVKKTSNKMILEWFGRYQQKYYDKVGAVDMLDFDRTFFVWGPEAAEYKFVSNQRISVFKRKS